MKTLPILFWIPDACIFRGIYFTTSKDLRRFARSPDSVFNPGATLSEIYSAEQRTGVVFPDEARASFTLFDGQARSTWLRAEVQRAKGDNAI